MQIAKLDINQAQGILGVLGCEDDPIFHKGEEITIRDLDLYYDDSTSASTIRIKFYGGKKCKLIKGSLYTMVEYRLAGK